MKRFLIFASLCICSCQVPLGQSSGAGGKTVVAGYVESILNAERWDTYDQYFAAQVNFNGKPAGKAELQRRVASFRAAYPDFRATIDEQVAEGDRVVTRLTCTGTHLGNDQGVAATGRKVTFTGIAIDRVEHGKVVEMWFLGDVWGRMQQIRSDL